MFSGIGVQHQNAVAEHAIGVIQNMACAMLLHLCIHWPDKFDPCLWPFGLSCDVWICNQLPHADRVNVCVDEIFSSAFGRSSQSCCACVFVCPTCAFHAHLQDGKKIPKWEACARTDMFLGFSDVHSLTVGLILNMQTGYESPKHHVVHDEKLKTVASNCSIDLSETWIDLRQNSCEF